SAPSSSTPGTTPTAASSASCASSTARSKGMRVKLLSTGGIYEVTEMGIFTPKAKLVERLGVGEVGFISGNIKDIVQAKIGDTITAHNANPEPLPGFQEVKPMVFAGIFPINT